MTPPEQVPTPRGSLGLLRDPVFGPYFAATVASATGVWIYNVVAAVVVFDLTGSALAVGAVSVAQFLPQVLLAPLAGARADRGDRARQLLLGRMVVAGGSGGLATWLAAWATDALPEAPGLMAAAPVIGASLVVGIGFALTAPAMMAILPALVRPAELSNAMALHQMPMTVARSVGPALGTLLLAVTGPVWPFVVAAVGNAVHGLVAVRVRLRPQERDATGDTSVRGGLRHLRADRACALLLLAVTAIGLGLDPVITLMPPLAAELGGDSQLVGVLVAAFGLGSGVVVVALAPLRRVLPMARMNPIGMGLFAFGYAAVALTPPTPAVLAALFVAGVGMMLAITSVSTELQQRVPEALRGRIMALWSVAYLGSRPVAAALNGAVADLASAGLAFGLMALVILGGAVVARPGRIGRHARAE